MGPPAGETGGTTLIDENGRAGGEKRPSDRSRPGRIPEPQALSTGHLTPPVSSRRDTHPTRQVRVPETILARWHETASVGRVTDVLPGVTCRPSPGKPTAVNTRFLSVIGTNPQVIPVTDG